MPLRATQGVAQSTLEDLAARIARQLADDVDALRLLVRREPLCRECDEFGFRRALRAVDESDNGGHSFAPAFVGQAHHRDLRDGGMLGEYRFDLDGVDVLPTGDDHVLHAVGDEQVAVLVDVPGVAGA